MNTALAIKLSTAAATLLKKKSFWITLVVILTLPLIIFTLIMTAVVSGISGVVIHLNEEMDLYTDAIKAVAEDRAISNYLSPYLVKSLDLGKDGQGCTTQYQAERFVQTYFVEETVQEEIQEDGSVIEIFMYRFFTVTEILNFAQQSPFDMTQEDIELLRELAFVPLEDTPIDTAPVQPGNYINPVDGWVSSPYGARSDPFSGNNSFHTGIDIVAQWHAPVVAITNGVVYRVASDMRYGNRLTLQHTTESGTFYTFYAHLSEISVQVGQIVNAGQMVGKEGGQPGMDVNPGQSTGHHLHFEILTSAEPGTHTNPLAYIQGY